MLLKIAIMPLTNELQVKKAKEIADGNKRTRHIL